MSKKPTPKGKYYKKIVYFEGQYHSRCVTVAVLLSKSDNIYIGMSICCPSDKEKVELGRRIASGRAKSSYDKKSNHSKSKKVIRTCGLQGMNHILANDNLFLKQIGRSFFYDFKANPKKYVASFEPESFSYINTSYIDTYNLVID